MITGNPVPLKVSEITPEVEAPERVTVTDVPAEKLLRALEVADKTIDLVLYYVEGDATYEGVKLKVDEACAKYTAFIKEGGE